MDDARTRDNQEPRIIISSSSGSGRRPPTTTRCWTFPPSTATRCWTFPPPYSYQQPISRRPSTDTHRWTFPAAVFVSPAIQPIAVGILPADARHWTFPAVATKTPHPTSPHFTSPHRRRLTTGSSSILPGWRAVSPSPASHTHARTHPHAHAQTHLPQPRRPPAPHARQTRKNMAPSKTTATPTWRTLRPCQRPRHWRSHTPTAVAVHRL